MPQRLAEPPAAAQDVTVGLAGSVLGKEASRIKRGEHSFGAARELEELRRDAALEDVKVGIVAQRIAFPSALDYVRFQLLATPMAALLGDRPDPNVRR